MPKIKYHDIKFKPATLSMIEQANAIIAEYVRQGFDLTLRQLYYQFVSRDLLGNTLQNYKNLGSIAEFGGESWELDALEPTVLATLVRTAIEGVVDRELMESAEETQQKHRDTLKAIADRFEDVAEFVNGSDGGSV